MLRFALINGLRPKMKNHVTNAQPTTWEGLVSSARVGEMCVSVPSIQDTTVSAQFELTQEQLRQLQADKSKPETAGSTGTVVDRRSKSPPPRRVHFDNEYTGYNDGCDDYTADSRRPSSGYGQGVFRKRGFQEYWRGRGHGNGPQFHSGVTVTISSHFGLAASIDMGVRAPWPTYAKRRYGST